MNSFLNELNQAAIPKESINIIIRDEVKRCVDTLFEKTINKNYDQIKHEILQKSKTGQFENSGNSKKISGEYVLYNGYYEDYLSKINAILNTQNGKDIFNQCLKAYPNVSAVYDSDVYSYQFSCQLLTQTRHSTFLGKDYYSYHLNNATHNVLRNIREKAANDAIEVSFSHINLDSLGRNIKITDGGNDKEFKGIYPRTKIVLKYSVVF